MKLFDDGTDASFAILWHYLGELTLFNARDVRTMSPRVTPPTSRAEIYLWARWHRGSASEPEF